MNGRPLSDAMFAVMTGAAAAPDVMGYESGKPMAGIQYVLISSR